jgi:hypothetical protein
MSKRRSPAPPKLAAATPSPEAAFRRAEGGYLFKGRRLEPFSFLRQTALLAIGLELGGSYAAEVAAAIWLMTLPDERVRAVRQDPVKFLEQIDQFADNNALGALAGRNYQQARDVFEQIRKDIETCTGKPKSDGGEADPDEHEGN